MKSYIFLNVLLKIGKTRQWYIKLFWIPRKTSRFRYTHSYDLDTPRLTARWAWLCYVWFKTL